MDKQLKRNAPLNSFGSDLNAMEFFVKSVIFNTVSTAIPVVVKSVVRSGSTGRAEYVSAMPLVTQTDADGKAIEPVTIPKLPLFRYQHGTAAIICDPVVGDVGLAVFAQSDCSNNNGSTTPKPPASFRTYDMSDGFFFGGFFGKTPTTFIQIEQAGTVTITAPSGVTINANTTINGNLQVNGTVGATQNITGGSVVLQTHTHGGVEVGSGNTGAPN